MKSQRMSIHGRLITLSLAAIVVFSMTTTVAHADLWWSNYGAGTVGHSNPDGTSSNRSFIAGRSPGAGVTSNSEYVYWANGLYSAPGSIGRARRDGTGVDNDFIARSNFPGTGIGDVAVDNTYIYFSQPNDGKIGRAKLDGTDINLNFVTGMSYFYGLSVDANYVYWADQGGGSIGRANIDGTSPNRNFISGASNPLGMTIDANHVYWNNYGTSTIGRANLDGSNVDQNFITGLSDVVGVAVDSNFIYWTAFSSGFIGRANLNGSGANSSWMATDTGNYFLDVDLPATTTTSTTSTTSTTTPPMASTTTIPSSSTTTPLVTGSPAMSGSTSLPPQSKGSTPASLPPQSTIESSSTSSTTTIVNNPVIPSAATGKVKLSLGGVESDAIVTRSNDSLNIDTANIDAVLSAYSSSGNKIPLDETGALRVSVGDIIEIDTSGFLPNTDLQVWLNSTPTLLGSFEVDTEGHLNSRVNVPASIATGKHRLSLVGSSSKGVAVLTTGILAGAVESNGFNLFLLVPLVLAIFIAITVPTTLRLRRKR